MKIIRFLFFTIATAGITVLLNNKIGSIPPVGKFLSPFTGFWQNAEVRNEEIFLPDEIKGLKNEAVVKVDSQRVPHIFAENEDDLYFLQGYLTARDRLWQMEFMIRAAGGRVSEIFGDRALEYDRMQRRIGIPFAAENSIAHLETDPVAKNVLNSYSAGVNAFIESLSNRDLPLEYKLLDYSPEKWTPYNSALLLKFMANMLTGKEYDFEYTNALKFLDRETFNLLFPDFPEGIDPIIPSEKVLDTVPLFEKAAHETQDVLTSFATNATKEVAEAVRAKESQVRSKSRLIDLKFASTRNS